MRLCRFWRKKKKVCQMSENKRFIQKDETIINTMIDESVTVSSEVGAKIIANWVNRLLMKNAELSRENYGLQDGLDYYKEKNGLLLEEISNLECENEQLKNEIKMLKSTIARNEAYITRLTKKGKWTK